MALALLLSVVFTVFFAMQAFLPAVHWRRHEHERIRPWMSVGYIARSHRVPPNVLYDALGLSVRPDRRPIRAIARSQQRPVDEVIDTLHAAISESRDSSTSRRISITDQLLSALSTYGLPALFLVVAIAGIGLPFPVSFVLVAAGSFVQQGDMKFLPVVIVSSLAAIVGDTIGYLLGRWAGRRVIIRLTRGVGAESRVKKAENFSARWGAAGIFFSRWLVTGFGPWINLTSGIAHYPWRRFILWVVTGETLWVILYVSLGYAFSSRVQTIADLLGNLTWFILGLLISTLLGWKLLQYARAAAPQRPVLQSEI
jgi:membrane protein DedA with SNARE-associated domain